LCQKEEIEIERDSFKEKYLKLNKFLLDTQTQVGENREPDLNNNNNQEGFSTATLQSLDRSRVSLCVDEIISRNKYLTESNRNLREELDMLKSSSKRQQKQPQPPPQLSLSQPTSVPAQSGLSRSDLATETSSINKQKVGNYFKINRIVPISFKYSSKKVNSKRV